MRCTSPSVPASSVSGPGASGLQIWPYVNLSGWKCGNSSLLSVFGGHFWGRVQVQPDERFESPSLGRALFEIYLGEKPVIPDAVGRWAEGTKQLLESENERRSSRKGGSG